MLTTTLFVPVIRAAGTVILDKFVLVSNDPATPKKLSPVLSIRSANGADP
jgi:hypothetical protein